MPRRAEGLASHVLATRSPSLTHLRLLPAPALEHVEKMRQPIDLYAIKQAPLRHASESRLAALWPHWGAMFRRGEHPFFRVRDFFRVHDFWSTSHPLTTPPLRRPAHDPEGDDQ